MSEDSHDQDERFVQSIKPGLARFAAEARQLVKTGSFPVFEGEQESKDCYANSPRYQLLERIAQGSMKEIWLVRDNSCERKLALARLHENCGALESASFVREARLTAQLQHPNIVPVYDMGKDAEGRNFFTMKLAEGLDLQDILRALGGGSLLQEYPLQRRLQIFERVCEAIAYAHSKGVLHLDIKPANVRVSPYGEVLLCDWGLAQVMDDICEDEDIAACSLDPTALRNMTVQGYVKGTPGFMAPEQFDDRLGAKDKRTDVFSLGILLYQLLCLQSAFVSRGLRELALEVTQGRLLSPSQRAAEGVEVPRGLEAVCLKAMSTDPDLRYASADELLREITAWRRGYATAAEKAAPWRQMKLFAQRQRAQFLTVAISSMLIFICLSVAFFIQRKSATDAKEALHKLQQEQILRHALAQKTAQQYLIKADQSWENYDVASVVVHVDAALALVPEMEQAQLFKKNILLVQGKALDQGQGSLQELALTAAKNSWNSESAFSYLDLLRQEHPQIFSLACIEFYSHLKIDSANSSKLAKRLLAQIPDAELSEENDLLQLTCKNKASFAPLLFLPLTKLKLTLSSESELALLCRLPQLSHLELSLPELRNLLPLESCLKLSSLKLSVRKLLSLEGVERLGKLQSFDCRGVALPGVQWLIQSKSLKTVQLSQKSISRPQLEQLNSRFEVKTEALGFLNKRFDRDDGGRLRRRPNR